MHITQLLSTNSDSNNNSIFNELSTSYDSNDKDELQFEDILNNDSEDEEEAIIPEIPLIKNELPAEEIVDYEKNCEIELDIISNNKESLLSKELYINTLKSDTIKSTDKDADADTEIVSLDDLTENSSIEDKAELQEELIKEQVVVDNSLVADNEQSKYIQDKIIYSYKSELNEPNNELPANEIKHVTLKNDNIDENLPGQLVTAEQDNKEQRLIDISTLSSNDNEISVDKKKLNNPLEIYKSNNNNLKDINGEEVVNYNDEFITANDEIDKEFIIKHKDELQLYAIDEEHNEAIVDLMSNKNMASAKKVINKDIQLATPLQDKNWGDNFNKKIMYMCNKNIKTAKININPPELGPIEISIKIDKNEKTSINFNTHYMLTKEAIESALPKLKQMLANNDNFDGIEVNVSLSDSNEYYQRYLEDSSSENNKSKNLFPLEDKDNLDNLELEVDVNNSTIIDSSWHKGLVDLYS